MESIKRLQELADDMNCYEIIDHVHTHPRLTLDGDWLDSWHKAFDKACSDIEAEIAELYMELPLDADGVPIHTGDMLQLGDTRSDVVALTYRPHDELPWEWLARDGEWHITAFARHVKPRTLEDVLQSAGVSVAAIEDVAAEIRELLGVVE